MPPGVFTQSPHMTQPQSLLRKPPPATEAVTCICCPWARLGPDRRILQHTDVLTTRSTHQTQAEHANKDTHQEECPNTYSELTETVTDRLLIYRLCLACAAVMIKSTHVKKRCICLWCVPVHTSCHTEGSRASTASQAAALCAPSCLTIAVTSHGVRGQCQVVVLREGGSVIATRRHHT